MIVAKNELILKGDREMKERQEVDEGEETKGWWEREASWTLVSMKKSRRCRPPFKKVKTSFGRRTTKTGNFIYKIYCPLPWQLQAPTPSQKSIFHTRVCSFAEMSKGDS